MKLFLGLAVVFLLATCLLLPFFTHPSVVNAMPAQSMAAGANFNCSSEDGRRKYCPTNTSGGVQLIYQRSGSPCTFGQTWGWDRQGVWVDRGCRADFEVAQAGWQPPQKQTIYCASDNGRRNSCAINTQGGARIIRQRSDADCIYGRTWGYDARRIWVDRGCRADFEGGVPR